MAAREPVRARRACPRCSSRCSATSSGGARSGCCAPASASASPAPSSSSSSIPATGSRSSGWARSASSTATGAAAGATTRAPAALLDEVDRPRHRARRRARVGVPVPVRRPGAAVGQLARPGHRPAGDGALGDAAEPPGRVFPVALRGLGIFQTSPPAGVRIAAGNGAHYLQYSGLPRLKVLNGFIQSLVGLYDFAALTGDPTALLAVRRRRPRGARGGADVRHRRLVAVLARLDHARVRPRLPQAAARLPRPALHAHGGGRVLRRRAALHDLPDDAADGRGAAAHAAPEPERASCASSCRRSRACR